MPQEGAEERPVLSSVSSLCLQHCLVPSRPGALRQAAIWVAVRVCQRAPGSRSSPRPVTQSRSSLAQRSPCALALR